MIIIGKVGFNRRNEPFTLDIYLWIEKMDDA